MLAGTSSFFPLNMRQSSQKNANSMPANHGLYCHYCILCPASAIFANKKRTMEHPLAQFRYCPECGSADFRIHDFKSKQCGQCGFTYYFNASAATAAFIFNERQELMVCRRGKAPAKGTLDLPGGFIDLHETAEEGIRREVKEETNLDVQECRYLFSLPNLYEYAGFTVHTLDLFFLCRVDDSSPLAPDDDASECFFLPLSGIRPEQFGLASIRKAVTMLLDACHIPS